MMERGERGLYSTGPVDNNSQGWVVAALVCLLAVACAFGAYTIHKRTYQNPRLPVDMIRSAVSAPVVVVG